MKVGDLVYDCANGKNGIIVERLILSTKDFEFCMMMVISTWLTKRT